MSLQSLTNRLTVTLIILLFAPPLFALTDISGKVLNQKGEPLPFANVLLLQPDSSLVKGDITSHDGQFSIKAVKADDYLLTISMIGYETEYVPVKVNADQQRLLIGVIELQKNAAQLAEVEVRARKPLFEKKTDRMVINVQHSLTSAGGSVLDILEKSPGVLVNRHTNTISMGGKSGVVIMINGKESRMPLEAAIQMLQGISAENVEKLELLTTPPAKYDAEGNAGLINIVLKKNENYGTNGSFSLNGGYGIYEKYGGNVNVNHRSGRINVYGDYSFSLDHSFQVFTNARSLSFNNTLTEIRSESEREPYRTVHTARLGADYELGENTLLGVLFSGYSNKWDMDAFNDVNIREEGTLTTTMGMANQEINHWRHLMGNLNLHHTLNDGQTLSFNADYLYYHDNNPTDYFNEIMDVRQNELSEVQFKSRKLTPINIWVGKMDYINNFTEQLKLEAGLKGAFSRFENDVRVETLINQVWQADPELTQFVTLREDILAAYSSFQYSFAENTTLTAGLRYEYTISHLRSLEGEDIVDRQYGNVFPTVNLSHNINDQHSLQASYNRRITRPTFNDLAPFVIFLDPYTFFSNNSALQPAISNTVKAAYQFNTWSFSVSYTQEDGAIARHLPRVEPETNEQLFAAANMDFLNTWNGTIVFPVYLTDWWETQNSATASRQHVQASLEGGTINTRQWSWNVNTTHSFQLPRGFSLEVSAFYQSESLWGYWRMAPLGAVNLGLQKEFGDGSKLRLSFSDIFQDNTTWEWSTDYPEHNLNTFFHLNFESRKLMLSYSRSFGSQKVMGARQRNTGSEAERQRITN